MSSSGTTMLSTSVPYLDSLLGGGVRRGELLEVCGAANTGKTQLCLRLAVSAASESPAAGPILYFTSSACHLEERLAGLVSASVNTVGQQPQKLSTNVESVLSRVHIVPIFDAPALLLRLQHLTWDSNGESAPPSLLVVDGLGALLNQSLAGSNRQHIGHAMMSEIGHALHRLAKSSRCAVVVTNTVLGMANGNNKLSGTGSSDDRPTPRPALGPSWQPIPDTTLVLMPPAGASAPALLIKSNRLPY